LFDPWSLLLSVVTTVALVSSWFAYQPPSSMLSKSQFVLSLLGIVLSTIFLGNRFTTRWYQLLGQAELVKKAESAIRNLKLLFTNIVNLEKQLTLLHPSQNTNEHFMGDSLELSLMMLKEEIIHAIEDWADVIPQANLKGHVEHIYDLTREQLESEHELDALTTQVVKKAKSKEEMQKLKQEVSSHVQRLKQIESELTETKNALNASILSGMTNSIVTSVSGETRASFQSDPPSGRVKRLPELGAAEIVERLSNSK
jgi:hypothetical protein